MLSLVHFNVNLFGDRTEVGIELASLTKKPVSSLLPVLNLSSNLRSHEQKILRKIMSRPTAKHPIALAFQDVSATITASSSSKIGNKIKELNWRQQYSQAEYYPFEYMEEEEEKVRRQGGRANDGVRSRFATTPKTSYSRKPFRQQLHSNSYSSLRSPFLATFLAERTCGN